MTALQGYELPAPSPTTAAPSSSFAYRDINIGVPTERQYLDSLVSISRYASRDAWRNYREIGEVHYGISRTARIAGYGRLFPEKTNLVGSSTQKPDAGVVAGIVSGIYGKFGGLRGLLERYYTLMKLPAEGYLIRVRENDVVDGYWLLSPDEIDVNNLASKPEPGSPVKWITAISGGSNGDHTQFTRDVEGRDFLGRIWNPSKQYVDMVDSPMTALNSQCEMLIILTNAIKGRLQQRFAMAGILLIPAEMTDVNIAGPRPGDAMHPDKIMNYLITLMTRNMTNHEDAVSKIPAILKGPAEVLDKVRHIILSTMVDEMDIRLRGELLNRILDGLDVSKQQTTGNEGTSHWGQWASADDERRIAVQPDLETFCQAVTRSILHAELRARGWTDERIRPWRVNFDLSASSVKSNMAEDARLAHASGLINDAATRKILGLNDADALTDEERIRWTGIKMSDPYLALYGIKEAAKIDWEKVTVSKPGPDPDSPVEPGKVGPGVGSPGSPADRDSDAPKSEEPG